MSKIGLLVGRERSFPDALIQEINKRNAGVTAEYVKIAQIGASDSSEYRVILDRISHEVIFYQPFLKAAVLAGTTVINNPFWRLADDKYFGTVLAQKLGIAVPKTLILPSREYPDSIAPESLSNLKYPIHWDEVVAYTGLPAILKPHWGGGWKDVHMVRSIDELLNAYNHSGQLCMMLQEFIDWQQYVRCICIGKTTVLITNWDPRKPHFERYVNVDQHLDPALEETIHRQAVQINQSLGYDMNTIEFAVRDGIPYAIDFMNSAPDFDISSLTDKHFPWVVNAMADMLIAKAGETRAPEHYRWDTLLNG